MLHCGVALIVWRVEEDNIGWSGNPERTRPLAKEVMRERCPSAINAKGGGVVGIVLWSKCLGCSITLSAKIWLGHELGRLGL